MREKNLYEFLMLASTFKQTGEGGERRVLASLGILLGWLWQGTLTEGGGAVQLTSLC
jgi:hypothetical protein